MLGFTVLDWLVGLGFRFLKFVRFGVQGSGPPSHSDYEGSW